MIKKIFKEEGQQQIARFLIKAFGLYVIWFVFYDFFVAQDGNINVWLNHRVATDASLLLNLLGFESNTNPGEHQTVLNILNEGMVGVGNPCNGLELFALFAGFIICFPGKVKTKLWFIPVGILFIHFINVLRTLALALIQFKAPQYLEFNHHYTFTIIVYTLIFMLWMRWVNHYSGIQLNQKEDKN
jgi:exosortase family protein XrtF